MKHTTILCVITLLLLSCSQQEKVLEKVEKWAIYEIELKGPSEGSPFFDVELSAEFILGKEKVTVPGFYDGNGTYRIRFSPEKTGKWTYQTISNDQALTGQSGSFECVSPLHKSGQCPLGHLVEGENGRQNWP